MPLDVAAPDRQDTWKPACLIELALTRKNWVQTNFIQSNWIQKGLAAGAVEKFADRDIDIGGTFYHGRIIRRPSLTTRYVETFFGVVAVNTAEFALSNTDGLLNVYYTVDPRGTLVTIKSFDESSASGPLVLGAPDGTKYLLGVTNDGSLVTTVVTGLMSFLILVLVAPDGTRYQVEVMNDGVLMTNVGLPGARQVILTAPDGTQYRVEVTNDGALVTTVADLIQFTGKITSMRMYPGFVVFTAAAPDTSIFEELFPQGIVAVIPFGTKAVGIGEPIPVVFGNVVRHRCVYVHDDILGNQYDYLVGYGVLTVPALYRARSNNTLSIIDTSEYTIETTRYSGFTTARFRTRQVSFDNSFHEIYADVAGLAAERNFARAVKTVLSDTTYGLRQKIDEASFATAEAALDAVGGLFCDASFTEQRQAQDVLNDLLMVRGMRLGSNRLGEWTLTVDTLPNAAKMEVADGVGDIEKTLVAVTTPLGFATTTESVRGVMLQFRVDPLTGTPRLTCSRRIHSGFGSDRVLTNPFIYDATTADRTVDYIAKREKYGAETMAVSATQEARRMVPGDIARITYAPLNLNGREMVVTSVGHDAPIVLGLAGWNADIYTYTPKPLPEDPLWSATGEYARDIPAVPSGFAITAGTNPPGAEGAVVAYFDLDWLPNDEEDLSGYEVQIRRTPDPPPPPGTPPLSSVWATRRIPRGTTEHHEPGVITEVDYDFRIRAVDVFNNRSAWSDIVTFGSVKDTEAPPAPTILVRQDGTKSVEIQLTTFTPPLDWGTVDVYRNTVDNSATATKIATGKKTTFHDQNVVYATQYFYWAKVVDTSGNESGFSLSTNRTVVRIRTEDIENGDIGRVGRATTASATLSNTGTETVMATYTNLHNLRRTTDIIESWFQGLLSVTDNGTGGVTGTVRIRRGTTIAGVLVHAISLTIPAGKAIGFNVAEWVRGFQVEEPNATGNVTYVLTLHLSGADPATAVVNISTAAFQARRKSA